MKTPIFEVLIRVIGKSNSLPNNNNKLTRWRLKTQLTVPRGEGEVVSCTEVAAPMGWLDGERRRRRQWSQLSMFCFCFILQNPISRHVARYQWFDISNRPK
jgi:hypothetical protein